jgi:hypothetical protein
MPLLHVALQEGFTGEPVVISVNGREIFHKTAVTTRTQIGLADSVEQTVPAGDAIIEVSAGGARARIPAPLTTDLYVGVSLTPDKQIVHRSSTQAFGYV